ncbi:hypothetical protein L207DRAFT_528262 [Hyaloscypha variabilis F]|uniref:MMS19 nucleotide excision repair protein n=1 Tax=Hyaloscypha variabilis (strain UAMH 11265 / GT02V1 / F) TaxID=1149755 RepID=A0A2J6RSZ9_HYAVF|nr:hypothetical protein L207DRAFT_528262 [Hyaloscypha variabilis F]
MTDHVFQDWMEAPTGSTGLTNEEEAIVTDYVQSLDLGVYRLPNLLLDMASYLDPDADLITAARALSIFPHILRGMGTEFSRQETHSLVVYFCARLENKDDILNYRAGIFEVATSLHVLSEWRCFVPGDAGLIAQAVFGLADGSVFKDQKPATRIKLFELVDLLLKKYQSAVIRDVTITTLVSGVVSMAELEKNPSCLAILFPLYRHISNKWPLEDSDYEAMWESFIRYFPITLGGAPQDPSVPTKELIKQLLLECILSDHHYSKGAIPRFIDMLDTNTDLSANLKIEVLSTLAACVKSYPVATTAEWSSKIWDALKFEIWNGENEDFIEGALQVLRATTESLGAGLNSWSSQTPMTEFVVTAATECRSRFHDSKKLYLVSSGRILHAIASGAPYAFHLVAKTVLPAMHVMWQDLKLPSEKKMLLTVYNYILDARLAQPEHGSQRDLLFRSFEGFRDGIVEVYSGAVSLIQQEAASSELPFGVPAVEGLALLFQIQSYLSAVEQGMIVQELNTILFSLPQDHEIRNAVLLSLQKISAMEPETFHEITLINFMEKLPETVSQNTKEREANLDIVVAHLQDLVEIACSQPCQRQLLNGTPINTASSYWHRNFDAMEKKLLEKLDIVLGKNGQLEYAKAILAAVCGGLQLFDTSLRQARIGSQEPRALDRIVGPYSYILEALLPKVAQQKDSADGPYIGTNELVDEKFVQMVGRTAMWALRSDLMTPENSMLLNWNIRHPDQPSAVWTLFTTGPINDSLNRTQQDLRKGPKDKCLANALSMYLLAGHRLNGPVAESPLRIVPAQVASAMIKNAISSDSGSSRFGRMCMLWLLQLLVSKYGAASHPYTAGGFETVAQQPLQVMTEEIEACKHKSDREIKNTYQTLAYFAAASITSFDRTMVPLVNMMIQALSDPQYGRKVGQSFRILLAESEIMDKANFCKIRVLRFQKIVSLVVIPLQGAYASPMTSRMEKDNIVIALAGVLAYMESYLVADAFGFSSIMLEGCVSSDEFTKEAFIHLLYELIPFCPKEAESHLDTVIRLMTDRTHNTYDSPSDASVRCRAKALDVLMRVTEHLPVEALISRRARLLPELDLALDDCARGVRGKAQAAKMKWLRLGG